jgi:DNA-binding response OmpR family regulator
MTIQPMVIVLVEDNDALNFAITLLLKKNGYLTHSFSSADALVENIDTHAVDLFIFDINLPGTDGFELLREVKPFFPNSDYIFISSYIDLEHITKAYALGCEDYLKKPFEIEELLLRITKIERRRNGSGHITLDTTGEYVYKFDTKTLYFHDEPLLLTNKESQVLYFLVKHRGSIVTFESLRERVWEKDVSNNTIVAVVGRLRKKLKNNFIQTIREIGYIIP